MTEGDVIEHAVDRISYAYVYAGISPQQATAMHPALMRVLKAMAAELELLHRSSVASSETGIIDG